MATARTGNHSWTTALARSKSRSARSGTPSWAQYQVLGDQERGRVERDELGSVLGYALDQTGGDEQAGCVSDDFRARHPDVPWQEIIGMRNRLAHDYLGTDADLLWEVLAVSLPDLCRRLGLDVR